ncbi:nuclear transport factor 2 family protein [Leptolyngbya sp. 7M]|uniref:nuclear transport factor 2 family protein n=1 Tax=Leptolyngbya sp. 7M TaxID=2812896 RepID=UPI001B8D1B2B|nr:nuclear transport factor 2 family protein [Leptolyngbya sp. 7M]QYO65548.1 nuclear transport factor 2 family protein [Leptolyngbya sp. 7M]
MRRIQFLVVLFVLFYSVNAQVNDGRIAEVLKAVADYDIAWNKKDIEVVQRFLVPEYVYFSSRGGLLHRHEMLNFLRSPDYVLTFAERSEIKAFREGNTVIVSSRWKGKGKYGETEINDDQRCGQVFVRSKGTWKLLSEHCVQIQPSSS